MANTLADIGQAVTYCPADGATFDQDAALADPVYSGGVGTLKAGTHSITIFVTTAPYPEGGAYIKIDKKNEIFALEGNRKLARKKFFG